jgi:hypothetical protein
MFNQDLIYTNCLYCIFVRYYEVCKFKLMKCTRLAIINQDFGHLN